MHVLACYLYLCVILYYICRKCNNFRLYHTTDHEDHSYYCTYVIDLTLDLEIKN